MLSERILSRLIHTMTKQHLALNPTSETMMPPANPGQKYMLYMHALSASACARTAASTATPFARRSPGPTSRTCAKRC